MSRQEPQHAYAVGRKLSGDIHDCGFFTASAIEIAAGDQAEFEEHVSDLLLCGNHLRRDRLHTIGAPLNGDFENIHRDAERGRKLFGHIAAIGIDPCVDLPERRHDGVDHLGVSVDEVARGEIEFVIVYHAAAVCQLAGTGCRFSGR